MVGAGNCSLNPSLAEITARLEAAFRPEAAAGLESVYQLRIGSEHALYLRIRSRTLEVHPGRCPHPSVTMIFDHMDTALGLLEGTVDPMTAFLEGRLQSDGNLILALQLIAAFRRSDRT